MAARQVIILKKDQQNWSLVLAVCLVNLKAKAEGNAEAEVSSTKPQSALLHVLPSGSSPPSVQPRSAALANAVRIERLSDDEDVDITDDLSDDASQPENQFDSRDQPKSSDQPQDQRGETEPAFSAGKLNSDVSDVVETSGTLDESVSTGNSSQYQTVAKPQPEQQPEGSWYTKPDDESTEGTSCLFWMYMQNVCSNTAITSKPVLFKQPVHVGNFFFIA